ncbi:MAG: PepSY domain-containing protein [Vicinamibacterales bacterium]
MGERYVQAWSTLTATTAAPDDTAAHVHEALNATSRKVVPWSLEQAPLPSAHDGHGRLTLDAAIASAQAAGIGGRFWVGVPATADGVWTVAQTAMNGDITDPRQELTVHVNPHSGAVIRRAGWGEYGSAARAMAAGIPLHEGRLGWWNLAGASLVCLAVTALSASGLAAWWLRRPARGWRLAAPPRPEVAHVPFVIWATAVILGVLFPLAGATILAIAAFDWLLVRRLPALRQPLN